MKDITLALQKVADLNNISLEEVRKEIQISIQTAMSNPDPEIQKKWAAISSGHSEPTPEELIGFLLEKIQSITGESDFLFCE